MRVADVVYSETAFRPARPDRLGELLERPVGEPFQYSHANTRRRLRPRRVISNPFRYQERCDKPSNSPVYKEFSDNAETIHRS
jgi:hypothetical protein